MPRKAAAKSKATKTTTKKSAAAKRKEAEPESEDEGEQQNVTVKGSAAVDTHFPSHKSYHVYQDKTGPWDFTGNQTNIGNNNNKFYIIQLLEADNGKDFKTWTRWGRVGVPGQNSIVASGNLDNCKSAFKSKFRDKTRNSWDDKKNFVAVKGKYDLVRIDYGADAEEEEAKANKKLKEANKGKTKAKKQESKLPKSVKDFVELIFDTEKMSSTVVEMQYDIKKLPLGKLTSDQIKAGYEALSHIEQLLKKKASSSALADASSDFYTRIPHVFGMKRPPVINSEEMLKGKLKLLEALDDIKVALTLISAGDDNSNEAEVDKNYKTLKCDMKPIGKSSATYKMVDKFMKNTHAPTHSAYTLDIEDLFEIEKDLPYDDKCGNKMLLWHGSRLTNWPGILGQGLRIAPPEAPCTGYMFGKGVYFADAVSKSANYCFTSRANNTGVLLLCEVALGNQNQIYNSNSMLHLQQPKGTHSTHGMGRMEPDAKDTITIEGVKVSKGKGRAKKGAKEEEIKVPTGVIKETGRKNPSGGFTLAYNEFIVYDTKQIRPRYLIRTKFNYKY